MLKGVFLGVAIVLATVFIVFCYLVQPAVAQEGPMPLSAAPACSNAKKVFDFLGGTYNESPKWFGNEERGVKATVFASPNGTWTIVLTDGVKACVILTGKGSTFILGEPT